MTGRGSDYTTKLSPRPVTDTVARLHALLGERGMTVFATIDQRAAARGVGLELRETVLILFGNPASGVPIMDFAPLAALDLPLKVLIWSEGQHTKVSYLSPHALAMRHHLTAAMTARITGIDKLTDALIEPRQPASGPDDQGAA